MPEEASYDFVSTGVRIEILLGRKVPEQMTIYFHSGIGADRFRDLLRKTIGHLWTSRSSGEQSSTAGGRQPRPKFLEIAFDQLDAFRWQWVVERLVVLNRFGLYDDMHHPTRSRADEVPVEIELDEIIDEPRRGRASGYERRRTSTGSVAEGKPSNFFGRRAVGAAPGWFA